MECPFYRVGQGKPPTWVTPDMVEGVAPNNYLIKTKDHGVIVGQDYPMSQEERKRREERLVKLHGCT